MRALDQPDVKEAITAGGSLPVDPPLTMRQWTAQFRRDIETWATMARAANVALG